MKLRKTSTKTFAIEIFTNKTILLLTATWLTGKNEGLDLFDECRFIKETS